MERSSEFKHLSEVDGENGKAVVLEDVSHGLFLGLDDHLVFADHEHVHVQPLAALGELGDLWVVGFRTLNEFPSVVEPYFFAFVGELTVNVLHNESGFENDQSAVNVRRSCFLLNMEGMHYKAVGFKFSVEPFDSGSVGCHGNLTKNVLSSSSEIGSIEDNLIILEAELKSFSFLGAFFFGHLEPVNIVHAVVHAVLGATLPHSVVIFSPESVGKWLIGLIFKETISS